VLLLTLYGTAVSQWPAGCHTPRCCLIGVVPAGGGSGVHFISIRGQHQLPAHSMVQVTVQRMFVLSCHLRVVQVAGAVAVVWLCVLICVRTS
jgi:hypothetical protein